MTQDERWIKKAKLTVRQGLILTAALLAAGYIGTRPASAGPWNDCHAACSPLTPDRIIPCECNDPDTGGTCVPDCDENSGADCSDCEEQEISGGILPRWELVGHISYLDYSDVFIGDAATLEDGLGLNLGAEYKFSEKFGLQVEIANERAGVSSMLSELEQDVDFFSVGLGTAFHLTPFQRYDVRFEPRMRYRFEEDAAGRTIPGELGYGAKLGLALPLDREKSIGDRWIVDIFAGYHVDDAFDQISFGIGFRKEVSPWN